MLAKCTSCIHILMTIQQTVSAGKQGRQIMEQSWHLHWEGLGRGQRPCSYFNLILGSNCVMNQNDDDDSKLFINIYVEWLPVWLIIISLYVSLIQTRTSVTVHLLHVATSVRTLQGALNVAVHRVIYSVKMDSHAEVGFRLHFDINYIIMQHKQPVTDFCPYPRDTNH